MSEGSREINYSELNREKVPSSTAGVISAYRELKTKKN